MSLEVVPRAGSYARGTDHPNSKLYEEDVIAVREQHAQGETLSALAQQYDVSTKMISQIVTGRCWRHVGGPIRPARSYTRKKH